jgi:Tfp pilus assembly protein PilV
MEVLIAMVILAIGLMALESLAIGASRSITKANLTTEYTLVGSQYMEAALAAARSGTAPTGGSTTLASGTRIDQVVETVALAGPAGTLYRVTITVTPSTSARRGVTLSPVTLTGRAFRAP